jgi:hypothetical protein
MARVMPTKQRRRSSSSWASEVVAGAGVGEQALFEADDGDGLELEALGGVERHQRDGALRRVDGVGVGDEGDGLEVRAEHREQGRIGRSSLAERLAAGEGGGVAVGVVLEFELAGGGDEFGEVVEAFGVGFALAGLGLRRCTWLEAGLLDDALDEVGEGGRRPGAEEACRRRSSGRRMFDELLHRVEARVR